jgi:Lrp/AsnC family leucine-responsive transcriptional regulator
MEMSTNGSSASGAMDALDWTIVRLLSADARIPWARLGAKVGLSAPAVADRVRRLQHIGVIKRYVTLVDPHHARREVLAFVAARMRRAGSRQGFQEWLEGTPAVMECHRVDGDYDYLLKIRCRDAEELDRVIESMPNAVGGVTARTTLVLVTLKEAPEMPLSEDGAPLRVRRPASRGRAQKAV